MAKMQNIGPWGEFGETVRYSLQSNARTARLACLMMIAILTWHYMF
jgi:hypothetical protein